MRPGDADAGELVVVRSRRAGPGISFLSGRTGGAGTSAGITKSFQDRKEALFSPREFTVLENYSGIAQIFDGKVVHDATRVYLKPDYVDEDLTYWRAREAGKL